MVLNLSALFRTTQKSAYVKIYLNIYQGLDIMLESIIMDLYYTSVNVNDISTKMHSQIQIFKSFFETLERSKSLLVLLMCLPVTEHYNIFITSDCC